MSWLPHRGGARAGQGHGEVLLAQIPWDCPFIPFVPGKHFTEIWDRGICVGSASFPLSPYSYWLCRFSQTRRVLMMAQVPWVSTADGDLGLVVQEGVACPPPPPQPHENLEGRGEGRAGHMHTHLPLAQYLTFFNTGTAKKQVTTAGVSKARCGMFKGHMPLRL